MASTSDQEYQTIKTGIIVAGITFGILAMGMVGCNMFDSAMEPEKIAANAEVELARSKTIQTEAAAIERLIKEYGVGAIAARCAIKGWAARDEKAALVCAVVAGQGGGKGLEAIPRSVSPTR